MDFFCFLNRLFFSLTLSALLFSSIHLHAQKKKEGDYMMNTAEMREDIDSLKSHIYQTPTDPFAFVDRGELDKHFLQIETKIKEPLSSLAFFRLLNPLMLRLKDIHSRIWLPHDKNSYVLEGGYFLPFAVRFLNNRIYLMEDKKKLIPRGSELIAVNGKAVYWSTRSMLAATYTDGNIINTRTRLMEENFTNLLPWFSKIDSINTLQIRFYGAKKDTLIQYKGFRKEGKQKRKKPKFKEIHHLEIFPEDQSALLTISSFAKGWENRYRSFLKASFKQMDRQDVKSLIIDIRGNKGGYIIRGPELLSYLTDNNYHYAYKSIVKASPLFKQRIKYNMIMPSLAIPLFRRQIGKELVSGWETPVGAYDTLVWEPSKPKPMKRRFQGDVYLLTDGLSISNSCLIHHAFTKNQMGIVIGNTCGCIESGTFGNSVDFQLPNSGIRGRISTIRLTSEENEQNFTVKGLAPDHIIEDNIDDLVKKKDTQLEYVLELIRKK